MLGPCLFGIPLAHITLLERVKVILAEAINKSLVGLLVILVQLGVLHYLVKCVLVHTTFRVPDFGEVLC